MFKSVARNPQTYRSIVFKSVARNPQTYRSIVFKSVARNPQTYRNIVFKSVARRLPTDLGRNFLFRSVNPMFKSVAPTSFAE